MPTALASPDVEQISLGGSIVETHDGIAATEMSIDFTNHTVQVAFASGTPPDNTFVPGAHGTAYWVKIDTVSGGWSSNLGTSGTLTAPQLATMNGNIKNARNGAEGLANALAVIPGTFAAWT